MQPQSGFGGTPIVELDGSAAGGADGLEISAGNCTVRSLVINRFSRDGIRLNGPGGNRVEGNFVGLDRSGTSALGVNDHGIHVGSPGNTIGGTTAAKRNVVSDSGKEGILFAAGQSGNTIQGNFIGTDAAGTSAIGNGAEGIKILSDSNVIGGIASGARNVIADSGASGVKIELASGTQIIGNSIGTDATGSQIMGNNSRGIFLDQANNNTIGGTTSAAANTIANNGGDGVALGAGRDGAHREGR